MDTQAGTIAAAWGSVQPTWHNTPPAVTDPSAPAVQPDPQVQAVVDAAVTATNPVTQQVINHASTRHPVPARGRGHARR